VEARLPSPGRLAVGRLLVGRWAPPALDCRPAPLLLQSTLTRGRGGCGRNAAPLDAQRLAEALHQALECKLAIAHLRALVLRYGAENRAGARDDAPLLRL
jgi:hypothetical protein